MTLNEKLFAHRDSEACSRCHEKIDPWGIPFENYDASGRWRDKVLVIAKTPSAPAAKPKKGESSDPKCQRPLRSW